MAKAVINIGSGSNAGDSLRISLTKTVANFDELYASVSTINNNIATLGSTFNTTASGFALLIGANFSGPINIAAPASVKGSNLTLVENASGGNGDLVFSTATGTIRWTTGVDRQGTFTIWQGDYGTPVLTIDSSKKLKLLLSPTLTTGHISQDGFSNVVWAGGDPTGQTDSTTAFQTSLDILAAAGGGTLRVPPGTFLLGRALTWNSTSSLTIQGNGPASIIIQTALTALQINQGQVTIQSLQVKLNRVGGTFVAATVAQGLTLTQVIATPLAADKYWDVLIDLIGCANVKISHTTMLNTLVAEGNISTIDQLNGMALRVRGQSRNFIIDGITVRGFYSAFDFASSGVSSVQNIAFSGCTVVDVVRGMDYFDGSGNILQSIKWSGGSITAFETCMSVYQTVNPIITEAVFIKNCLFNMIGSHILLNTITSAGVFSNNIVGVTSNDTSHGVGGAAAVQLVKCDGLMVLGNAGTLSSDASGFIAAQDSTACTLMGNRGRGILADDLFIIVGGSNNLNVNNRKA